MGPVVAFLVYLEAPNSIFIKKQNTIIEFYKIPPIPPIAPRWANGCLGPWAAVTFDQVMAKPWMALRSSLRHSEAVEVYG